MEVKTIFIVMCLATGLVSTNAEFDFRDRVTWELKLINEYKDRLTYGMRNPPDMWALPTSLLPRDLLVSMLPDNESCKPCPEPFTCDELPFDRVMYLDERFYCGRKQKVPWKMDGIPLKKSLLPVEEVPATEGGSCGLGNCYSVCYHKDQESPNCKEGYYFHSEDSDICTGFSNKNGEFTYWKLDSESPYSEYEVKAYLIGGKCCKAFSEQCSDVDVYASTRPYFECHSIEYNGKCESDWHVYNYLGIALKYCDETRRKFLCCCNHECYWTECQSEAEILERERKYIGENYCQDNVNTKICDIANGYTTYYDLLSECSIEYEDKRFETDFKGYPYCSLQRCNTPKYLDTCQLLGYKFRDFTSPNSRQSGRIFGKEPSARAGFGEHFYKQFLKEYGYYEDRFFYDATKDWKPKSDLKSDKTGLTAAGLAALDRPTPWMDVGVLDTLGQKDLDLQKGLGKDHSTGKLPGLLDGLNCLSLSCLTQKQKK